MKKNINVNPITQTIEVSTTFLKRALIFGTPEYYELKEIRVAEPNFSVKEISIKKNANKKTYNNLTFAAMIAHINLMETDEAQKDKTIKEFEEIQKYSKVRGSSYPIVKKWFLNKYKESYAGFLNESTEKPKEEESKEEA